jgi:antitoxin ParD1/3/4
MASTKATLNVELSAKQQAILQRQLESGHYENANEVIDDALRLMNERDAVFDEWLRGEVNAVMADKRAPVPAETVFKRLEARHARRVKAPKRGK